MKTAMTIVADLVRSVVISGLAAASLMLLTMVAVATIGYGLWWLWRHARR